MKIIIHRGTNQIGGCITEIASDSGARIIVDIGANLANIDGEKKPEIDLEGLTFGNPKYDAVLVTHYHGDHIGLYSKVLKSIPIYTSEITKGIFEIVQEYLSKVKVVSAENIGKIKSFNTFKIPEKIEIKDIVITPIGVDHSAFDSHMFLIECDGKKLLHTGDFRMHGQRGRAVLKAIEKYVGKVDCLITEGTMFSRDDEVVLTEMELQIEAQKIFEDNKYVFVLCSSTNIDRVAAFHKATIASNKMFVVDGYQNRILEYINSVTRSGLYEFNNGIDSKVYCYGKNMLDKMKEHGFVMLIRPNSKFKSIIEQFPNSKFIYSEWLGYLKSSSLDYKLLQSIVPEDYIYLHTSGHATKEAIKEIIELTLPNTVIPIHTECKEKIKELTDKSKILEDNEEFIIY